MNPVIVVEGTTDFTKIKQVGYKYCVKTCGFCVSRETISFLKTVANNRKIVLLFDPDGPGRNIAKKVKEQIPEAVILDPFKASESKRHGKVGIAYISIDKLKEALKDFPFDNNEEKTLSLLDLQELGLAGNKARRIRIANYYNISSSSLNSLLDSLNMLCISKEELKGVIGKDE